MSHGTFTTLLRHIHKLTGTAPASDPGSSQLLERFAASRDEAAFTELVRRYGTLVWSVCRRVLAHDHDAEDAFQATFLVLARKAASLRHRSALGGWLHRVAYHIAVQARADAARRRQRESRTPAQLSSDPVSQVDQHELGAILNEELSRLPEKHRAPLVLCYFEGKTHQEAAVVLGWPAGSMSWRVGKALAVLRSRLSRRGVALPGTALAAALAENAATAVPVSLAQTTVKVVLLCAAGESAAAEGVPAALAAGMLRVMWLTKVKVAAALVVVVGLLGGGASVLLQQGHAEKPADTQVKPTPAGTVEQTIHRDFVGDPLPPGAFARLGTIRWRHPHDVSGVDFSPDGKKVVSCSLEGDVYLWDRTTGQLLREMKPHIGSLRSVAFSPDATWVAVCGGSPDAYLMDAATGERVAEFGNRLCGVNDFHFAPEGRVVAVALSDKTVRLLELPSGKDVRVMEGHQAEIRAVRFSAKGNLLASADESGMIRLWDVATGKEAGQLTGHQGKVWSVAFSPDGKLLASTGVEPVIRLWDVAKGSEVGQLKCQPLKNSASFFWKSYPLLFTPDGKHLAWKNQLWDVAARREVRQFGSVEELASLSPSGPLALSPDGKVLASTFGRRVHLWDVETGQELYPWEGHRTGFARFVLSPNGKTAATIGSEVDPALRLWNTQTGKQLWQVLPEAKWFSGAPAFSPDGKYVAVGHVDHTVHVLEVATGRETARLHGHQGVVDLVRFSPDGKLLASKSWDLTARLWDLASKKEIRRIPLHERGGVSALAFSPDGKLLATPSGERAYALWDVATGKHVRHIEGPSTSSVAFSPDSRTLLSFTGEELSFWEVATGKRLEPFGPTPPELVVKKAQKGVTSDPAVFRTHREFPLTSASAYALSPDGRTLALARHEQGTPGEVVYVYEMATARERLRLRGHRGKISSLWFTDDGRSLVSASQDTTALFWDLTGQRARLK